MRFTYGNGRGSGIGIGKMNFFLPLRSSKRAPIFLIFINFLRLASFSWGVKISRTAMVTAIKINTVVSLICKRDREMVRDDRISPRKRKVSLMVVVMIVVVMVEIGKDPNDGHWRNTYYGRYSLLILERK